jgi:hypothetical protein
MLWEVDASDPVDGINLPVEILHGFDGVGIRNLGGCVDPEAACVVEMEIQIKIHPVKAIG